MSEKVFDIRRHDTFTAWFDSLTDIKIKARIEVRIERASKGNFGDWSPEGGDIRAMCCVLITVPVIGFITLFAKKQLSSSCAEGLKRDNKKI